MHTIYFGLETAGLEMHHPIIQIAAVAVAHGQVIDTFERKLHFDLGVAEPKALELNSYDEATWQSEAIPPYRAARKFAEWLHPYCWIQMRSKANKPYYVAQLAGYNAASCDAPRLQKLYKDVGAFLPASYRVLDVLQLVMWTYFRNGRSLENYKLGTVCKAMGVDLGDEAHDALADVKATAEIALRLASPYSAAPVG